MYRGPRPHRGAYPPSAASRGFAPRGPPPPSAYPGAPYRAEHARDTNGYPHGYRRQPEQPRKRYSSPGRGSGEDFRGDGPPPRDYGHRYTPSPPHSGLPTDHSLVITVGNELTGLSQSTGVDVPFARDYSPQRSSYEAHDEHRLRRRSDSRCRNRGWSRSPDRIHSRSRPRSRSRSRAVSRSRALSRGRSRPRSRSRSGSRSRGRSRARSRARSKSRPCSRSRSRGRSPSRSRGKSRGRSRSRARSKTRNRQRSRSRSGTSSSSASSRNSNRDKEDFRELERARRRKELEDMLTMPTKSILKKRVDSSETDSPMIGQSTDSPHENPGSGLSKDAEQLLCAVTKTMDPDLLASVLSRNSNASAFEELISKLQPTKVSGHGFPLPHESSSQENSDLTQLLSVMAEAVAPPMDKKKGFVDIEDEEKFLYGDEEEEDASQTKEMPKSGQRSLLDVYERTGADVLYHEPRPGIGHDDLHRKEFGGSYSQHPEEGESQITKQSKYRDKNYSKVSPGQHLDEEPRSKAPVTSSHDAQVRAEVEEYEKIQDLLKTIGLDLGVAEISKMAARTQERLQGKNPGKSSVKRHQSDRKRRSHSRSSSSTSGSQSRSRSTSRRSSCSSRSSHSRSRSYKRTLSHSKKKFIPLERHSSRSDSQSKREGCPGTKPEENTWTRIGPPPPEIVTPGTNNFPTHSAHPISPYPQPQSHMPPNYPPPGYDPYRNYMPYMPQGWPMYPPPAMPMPTPTQSSMKDYSSPTLERPFLKVINTVANEAQVMDKKGSKVDPLQSITIACSGSQRRVIEEKNNANQKQKVAEELEKLKKDRDFRIKKKESLLKELETLRKQQGELLRKKRREKDGHKDPILLELGRLQEDVMAQISVLRNEHEAAEKKHEELVKVATILGLDPRNLRSSAEQAPSQRKSKESRSPEKSKSASNTSTLQETRSSAPGPSSRSDSQGEKFEYYDAGNHWCKNCNVTSGSMFDFFTHLHSKTHRKTIDPYARPWASNLERDKKHPTGELVSKPAKGSEFVLPVRGFFCQLCKEFFGDPICAEAHVLCHEHNEKYKKQMYENPLYEQRRNLDRQAGLEKKQTEHKRKHEDDDSQDEQKNSCKDQAKKPKNKNEDEDHLKYVKEEDRKSKYVKEEENKPKSKKEEERTRYTKEDWEKNKFKKEEEERYRQKKGDEERYKSDEDKYKYKEENRYKYREDNEKYKYRREDEKSKYRKEDDKKYKYVHESEEDRRPKYREEEAQKFLKSKWEEEEEEEEERPKYGKREDKKEHQRGGRKDEKEKSSLKDAKVDPEKPVDLPKVLCGPSPAMLAKLRKKNEDFTSRPVFGKFTWKKPEKTALEKEAEKIAEQFIKEDEESVGAAGTSKNSEDQDAFAKSVAAAKSIAIKLSGKTAIEPSQEWVTFNQNKTHPTLPNPSNPLRKSNVGLQNKPASVDTPSSAVPNMDSSSKTSKTETKRQAETEDVISADLNSKAFGCEEVKLDIPYDGSPSLTFVSDSLPTPSTVTTPSCTVQEVERLKVQAPVEHMITLVSDVAAPGVPEEEHKLTVMVRPPPQLQTLTSSSTAKTVKPKSNLAAAKAKDLFNIFYGSSAMTRSSGSSTGSKVDSKEDSKLDLGLLVIAVNKESTQEQDSDTKHVTEVSSLKCDVPCEDQSKDKGEQSEPPTFELAVEPLVNLKAEKQNESLEMATVDCKDESNPLDCLASSEILENIEMIGANDPNQNPLDSEEAMTLSFSPPPGSFTEQLNLDTFEFSFDSL